MKRKNLTKKIGKLFGLEVIVSGKFESNDAFERDVEAVKNAIGSNPNVYFYGYPNGHHPAFFEKYPRLTALEKQ